MPKNPLPPESKPNPDTSSKSRDHKYAEYIDKSLKDLIRLEPKYDKSIFEIKQEQEQVFSENPYQDQVALANPKIPTSPTAGPADIFGRTSPLEIPEAESARAAAEATQKRFFEEYKKELNEYKVKKYKEKLAELINSLEKLAVEAGKINASRIQEQIKRIKTISIEDLPGLGLNEDTIEFVSKTNMELIEQYNALVKEIEASSKKVKSAQKELEDNRKKGIKENLEKIHIYLANVAVSTGIDDLEPYNDVQLDEDNTEVILNALQQRIDEFKRKIQEDKIRMIKEKRDEVIQALKDIDEIFEILKRNVEELNVVKENGKKLQEAIDNNYNILSETENKIKEINVQSKLDELMELSDEMETAIQKRIEDFEEKEYSIDEEEKVQDAIKKCNNEYFLNLRNATVNHIKLTIDKLKEEGKKNIKNEDIKARIYAQIEKGGNKSRDLNFYLFLSIVDFLLFMINPPEYKKEDKKLNYKNLKPPFYKGINDIINKEAEKLENVQMLFGFIKRRRYLRDIDENWLCENI